MALQEYITIPDVKNRIFQKLSPDHEDTLQEYVDEANEIVEDLAIQKDIDLEDIAFPVHVTLRNYAINYCLRQFAAPRIGLNNKNVQEDIYKDLFDRSQYLMNLDLVNINRAVITKVNQNSVTRSTSFGRVHRR